MAGDLDEDHSTAALDLDNDNYDSAEDSDFQLDEAEAVGEDSSLSSSDEEVEAEDGSRPTKKRKLNAAHKIQQQHESKQRRGRHDGPDDMELDSGDEATILKAKNKKNKKRDVEYEGNDAFSDIEEGLFVKTRAMRSKMEEERRPLAKMDGATIDVDDLWAKMNAPGTDAGLLPSQKPTVREESDYEQQQSAVQEKENLTDGEVKAHNKLPADHMIKIKRTYKFAGEIHTEEKTVPRDSAEAKLYLAETTGDNNDESLDGFLSETAIIKLRRPLRKVSRFDPNPTGIIKKSWEKNSAQAVASDALDAKGRKINTVEKSRLDWAQYVDEAGIKDELNVHSKAKEGYLGRMDFLNRVDANREEERRNIRIKGL